MDGIQYLEYLDLATLVLRLALYLGGQLTQPWT